MVEYVRDFIKYCENCQKTKSYDTKQAPLRPVKFRLADLSKFYRV